MADYDHSLERDVLGSMLAYPENIEDSGLTPDSFHMPAHAHAWGAMLAIYARGEDMGTMQLRSELADAGLLEECGGEGFVLSLTDTLPSRKPPIARLLRLERSRKVRTASHVAASHAGRGDLASAARELEEAQKATCADVAPVVWRGIAEIFTPLLAPSWLVPGLHLGPGRPAMLAGYGASAKTLSAQSLALAVASGSPVWGEFAPKVGLVRHFDYEQGFYATARRYQRLAAGHRIDREHLGNRLQIAVFPKISLDAPGAVSEFARATDGAALAIIDSLKAATPTRDENSSDIRTCVDVLTQVSEKTGCTFFLLHHAGKPREGVSDARTTARGSSAIFDACGCVYTIVAGKKPADPRKVMQVKAPAEAEGGMRGDFLLHVEDITVDGDASGGVRVVYDEPEQDSGDSAEQFEFIVKTLLEFISVNPGASRDAVLGMTGVNRSQGGQALNYLEDKGMVSVLKNDHGRKTYTMRTLA